VRTVKSSVVQGNSGYGQSAAVAGGDVCEGYSALAREWGKTLEEFDISLTQSASESFAPVSLSTHLADSVVITIAKKIAAREKIIVRVID
jgi:hypothetical protein